jgi:hypothetical protein
VDALMIFLFSRPDKGLFCSSFHYPGQGTIPSFPSVAVVGQSFHATLPDSSTLTLQTIHILRPHSVTTQKILMRSTLNVK